MVDFKKTPTTLNEDYIVDSQGKVERFFSKQYFVRLNLNDDLVDINLLKNGRIKKIGTIIPSNKYIDNIIPRIPNNNRIFIGEMDSYLEEGKKIGIFTENGEICYNSRKHGKVDTRKTGVPTTQDINMNLDVLKNDKKTGEIELEINIPVDSSLNITI